MGIELDLGDGCATVGRRILWYDDATQAVQPMKKLMCLNLGQQQQRVQINIAKEEELFVPGDHLQTIQHQYQPPIHHTIERRHLERSSIIAQ
jgi:hypothetical protein